MDLSVCDTMYRSTPCVWFISLFLFASLHQIQHIKGDNIEVKLTLNLPWQSIYLVPSSANTLQLTMNLKATAVSIYSSYPEPITIEVTSFYQHNGTQTGCRLQISSDGSWNDTAKSKVAHFVSNYLSTNNRRIEVSGQVYDVTDGLYYVTTSGQILVDDLCFLFDGENLCKNGGTCKVDSAQPVCGCTAPFVGEFCAISTVSGDTKSPISIYIIILICAAAVLVVVAIAVWVVCRSNKKENVEQSVSTEKGDPGVLASSDSLKSGGAPQVLAFPNVDQNIWLTESDQNLMSKEGPKVLMHLYQKHVGRKKHKSSDAGTKTKGSVFKKRNEGTTGMVGSGEYQNSIVPMDGEPNGTFPRGILKPTPNWQFGNGKTDSDYEPSLAPPLPNRLDDQYEGSHTRVTVTDNFTDNFYDDNDTVTTLPPITEVGGSRDFENYDRYEENSHYGY